MPITLRIVGLFYNRSDIPDKGTQTVKDVLDYAVIHPGSANLPSDIFRYVTSITEYIKSPNQPHAQNPKPSVTAFFSNYTQDFKSLTSGAIYPKGEYFLPESLVDNPNYLVWQYYVFDKNGAQVKLPKRIFSFVDAHVPDGGSVIWRLVKVLTAPNRVPTVYRKAFGLSDPAQAVA